MWPTCLCHNQKLLWGSLWGPVGLLLYGYGLSVSVFGIILKEGACHLSACCVREQRKETRYTNLSLAAWCWLNFLCACVILMSEHFWKVGISLIWKVEHCAICKGKRYHIVFWVPADSWYNSVDFIQACTLVARISMCWLQGQNM